MRVLLVFGVVIGFIVVAGAAFAILIPKGSSRDCNTVSVPTASQFTALDPEQQQDRMSAVLGCKQLDGKSREDVQAAFGAPAKTYGNALEYAFDVNGTYAGGQPYPPDTTAILFSDDGRMTDWESKATRDPSAR